LNDAFQLKGGKTAVDIMRLATNTVFGLGGLIDVATELKVPRNNEDFGQTLGYWGVKSGPYLVLPILGPSDVRDTVGLVGVDLWVDPVYWGVDDTYVQWTLYGVRFVDTRANLLEAEKFLEQAAIDPYSFLRDTYLQRRDYLIHDGKVDSGVLTPAGTKQKSLRELEEEDLRDNE